MIRRGAGWYSDELFVAQDIKLLERAIAIVERLPGKIGGRYVRCHELARFVLRHLDSSGPFVVDGKRDCYEHSWIMLPTKCVLDVYVPGHLPQVALVAGMAPSPRFQSGPMRNDIREDVLAALEVIYQGGA